MAALSKNSPSIRFPAKRSIDDDPVVISGIGLATSLAPNREAVWQAIQRGESGIRDTRAEDGFSLVGKPCGLVDWLPANCTEQKSVAMTRQVASEALDDAAIDWSTIDRNRFACSISAQFGDIDYLYLPEELRSARPEVGLPWWDRFLPCSASGTIGTEFGLHGPRLCHATACASGLISLLAAARMIQDDAADMALCGAADAIHDLLLTSFHRMGVLADDDDPTRACRPFDQTRKGFVMGEGAAMMVLEKRSHAIQRGATIYAELASWQTLCQAHHVTGLDTEADTLTELVRRLNTRAGWAKRGPQYINAHGTGTAQNDESELNALKNGLPHHGNGVRLSSNKAVIGHLINAAGSVELALTALAIRDQYAPPTINLNAPDSPGAIDCLPGCGTSMSVQRTMKLSLAFGGHLVGIALQQAALASSRRSAEQLASGCLDRRASKKVLREEAKAA